METGNDPDMMGKDGDGPNLSPGVRKLQEGDCTIIHGAFDTDIAQKRRAPGGAPADPDLPGSHTVIYPRFGDKLACPRTFYVSTPSTMGDLCVDISHISYALDFAPLVETAGALKTIDLIVRPDVMTVVVPSLGGIGNEHNSQG